ncbi:hypothetical protein D3C84_742420 [compost metagenome]
MFAVGVGALGNIADLTFDACREAGNVFQVLAGVLDLLDTDVEVAGQLPDLLHHLRGALLDIGHHLADFAGRRRCARGQAANLVGDDCEPATVLPGPCRFDGRVQCQQIGLAGNGLDHQRDPLDIVAAQAQGFDQLTTVARALTELMHAGDGFDQLRAPCHAALMRFAGGTEGRSTECRGGLFGGDHHFSVADNLCRGTELRLQFVGQLLDRKGHAGGRQGVMTGGVGKIASQFGDGAGVVGRWF